MSAWSNQIIAMPPAEGGRHGHTHLRASSFPVSSHCKLEAMFELRRDVLYMLTCKGTGASLQTYSTKKAKAEAKAILSPQQTEGERFKRVNKH